MTAAEAHAQLRLLHGSKKRRLPDATLRALEYAMAMIAERIGNEVLDGYHERAAELSSGHDAAGLPPQLDLP